MLKRLILSLVATAVAMIVGLLTVQPAQATTCFEGVCIGGNIGHHDPDNGYDQPIFIVCNWADAFQDDGDPRAWSKLVENGDFVAEGEKSGKYCGIDTDVIVVRDGEQIACRETDRFGNHSWPVKFDASGPHKITDNWHENHCVTQAD